MYKPDSKTKRHFLILAAIASLIGWAYYIYFKPLIVETSCSNVAAASTNLLGKRDTIYPDMTYDNVKLRCIEEAMASK